MLSQLFTIARNTFVESVRQPILLLLVLISGLLQVFNTWTAAFSMGRSSSAEVYGDNKLLLDVGLATIFGAGVLMAAFLATAVISSEIERKTMLTVVSKPISRAWVVVGKYLGVAGAITGAVVIMLAFLLLAIRHGVMSTAGDNLDMPVILFSLGAVIGSLLLAAAGNFMYGWSFNQTAVVAMLPLVLLAYLGVLLISKKWEFQPITSDLPVKILIACSAMVLAILVLTAVATAASTRLGQVMTIVVCAGVFLGGLLSNYFLGRQAFSNDIVGVVDFAQPPEVGENNPSARGAFMEVTLKEPPRIEIEPGDPFFYGPNPNGVALVTGNFTPFAGDPSDTPSLFEPTTPSGLVVQSVQGKELVVQNIGRNPLQLYREPERDDYVFITPTRVEPVSATLWAVIPNMHYYWLLDAVTQNREVPASHLLKVVIYALLQIAAFLALAIALFQRRDVG
ncbi:MAG: ABC transporter permease subunit [Phycisphaerales bacterium]